MTDRTSGTLKELQELDIVLEETRKKIDAFDPLLAEVEEPALALEQELEATRKRLQEMKLEERRLEHDVDDRRARTKKLQDRLKAVRNLREEAAVQAESELLQRSLETDEQEALSLLDQIRKLEQKESELVEAQTEARAEVEPKRKELQEGLDAAQEEFAVLKNKRDAFASGIPEKELHNYERIRGGGRSVAVSSLTPDGACGHCFGMVPLQTQNEIRGSGTLIPCEFCGVLLGPEEELG